jgi:hypothetical protein
MKKMFAIQHKSTGATYDPYENKFYPLSWDIVWCDDKAYLEQKIKDNAHLDYFDNAEVIDRVFLAEEILGINMF